MHLRLTERVGANAGLAAAQQSNARAALPAAVEIGYVRHRHVAGVGSRRYPHVSDVRRLVARGGPLDEHPFFELPELSQIE